jgi:hypothetical protein
MCIGVVNLAALRPQSAAETNADVAAMQVKRLTQAVIKPYQHLLPMLPSLPTAGPSYPASQHVPARRRHGRPHWTCIIALLDDRLYSQRATLGHALRDMQAEVPALWFEFSPRPLLRRPMNVAIKCKLRAAFCKPKARELASGQPDKRYLGPGSLVASDLRERVRANDA